MIRTLKQITPAQCCLRSICITCILLLSSCGGQSTDSASIPQPDPQNPDTIAPTVSITTPASGEVVVAGVTVTAQASDNVGVAGVQFKLDGNNLGAEDTTPPYSLNWNTTLASNGSHVLTALARDAAGNAATSSVTVTVSNVTGDVQAPTVPENLVASSTLSTEIHLSWSASTDNVGVSGYDVYRNGTQVGTTAGTTYADSGLSPSTTYYYAVAAYDTAGNVSAQSATLAAATTATSLSYTTNFDLDENPISEGGAWTNIGLDWTPVVSSGGIAYGTHHNTGYNDSYAALSGFAPDQSAEATIFVTGSFSHNQEVELLLRWTQSAHVARGYEINWNANNFYAYIVRWNGALGDFTLLKRLDFPRPPVTGDVMKAQIVGSQITVYLNGSAIGSYSDSTWTTGSPGIGFYSEDSTGEQNARYGFTSFRAGN